MNLGPDTHRLSRSMLIEKVDADELVDQVAAVVVDRMRPLLSTSTPPLLVDGAEMARLASVSTKTIERLSRAEKIPSVSIGKSRRYEPTAVIKAMASDRGSPAKP